MRMEPIEKDSKTVGESVLTDSVKPNPKSPLARLFDLQLSNVLRMSLSEKTTVDETAHSTGRDSVLKSEPWPSFSETAHSIGRDSVLESEPWPSFYVCKLLPTAAGKFIRSRCNCFNVTSDDGFDEEVDAPADTDEPVALSSSCEDTCENLMSLITCESSFERNLLADAAKIVEKNSRIIKQKGDLLKIVVEDLSSLCYDSSVCKSTWEKGPSLLYGTYEYIEVLKESERYLVEIDFRSEFEIARAMEPYKAILELLPNIFVGRSDRLRRIVSMVTECAVSSFKKGGLHLPPWRRSDYMLAKWLSPYTTIYKPIISENDSEIQVEIEASKSEILPVWEPPAFKPRSAAKGKTVAGLTSLFKEKP